MNQRSTHLGPMGSMFSAIATRADGTLASGLRTQLKLGLISSSMKV